MSPQPTGLRRDLNLIRRRAWLFIPFFLLGIVIAYVFGSVAGEANAVASLTLDTLIQDVSQSGDRGFRIFEAESMTGDPRFKDKVVQRIGEKDFDYGRFSISLSPISVADGVSRGVLTVSIKDPQKADAERYRQAFVEVFTEEYTSDEGLFRTRFIEKKQAVVDSAEAQYDQLLAQAKPQADAAGLPIDELIRPRFSDNMSLADAFAQAEAQLRQQLALANADGNATEVARLTRAIDNLEQQRLSVSDAGLSPELRRLITDLRSVSDARQTAYVRLNEARASAASAQSDIEASYTFSGGLTGSLLGRVAIVIAVTLVFGLIAIYAWEWLSQVRAGVEDPSPRDTPAASA